MSAYDRYQLQLQRLQQGPDTDYAKRKAVASLFMDDNAMLEYLASQRFPDDPGGAFRYQGLRENNASIRCGLGWRGEAPEAQPG